MADNSSKPPCRREDALAVLQTLRNNGQIAYFAGGCVRDLLLGLEPKDYDVATDAPPARVRQIFPRTQSVGAAFGVMLVRQGRSVIEVATFRSDLSYADGRRPEGVRFSSPEEDAQRRDFTINGLFLDPLTDTVIDFVNGQTDLKNRILRAIGNPEERFAEDHLRILRAIRFAARFNLEIDPATWLAIKNNAPKLIRISPERIAEELRMMLCPPTRAIAACVLWDSGIDRVIFRDLPEKPPANGPEGLFLLLCGDREIPFGIALAALVLDYRLKAQPKLSAVSLLEKSAAQRCAQVCRKALKISNDEAEMLRDCLNIAHLLREENPTIAAMKRFLAGAHSRYATELLNAVAQIDVSLMPRVRWLSRQFTLFPPHQISPPPLITGEDLLAAGLAAGPLFKQVLHDVYDAQLENKISTPEQAMQLAMMISNEKK